MFHGALLILTGAQRWLCAVNDILLRVVVLLSLCCAQKAEKYNMLNGFHLEVEALLQVRTKTYCGCTTVFFSFLIQTTQNELYVP